MSEPVQEPAGGEPAPRRYGRGVFLLTVAGGVSSLAWGKSVWGHVSSAVSPVASSLAPFLPTGGWRIYTVSGSMPTFDRATWRLKMGGLVEKPVSLSYDELLALPKASQISTFHCVTGWTVQNVHWGGVRLTDLLDRTNPLPEAGALQFVSAEQPYVDYLTMQQALLHDVMLAYEMDGKPLPRDHGAPLRLDHPRDVRLQEREVAERDQPRQRRRLRLLGAARLRPGRLGRPLQRLQLRPHASARAECAVAQGLRHAMSRYLRRFSRTERTLHWVNALGFFMLLATGLILYLPSLSVLVGRRPLIKDIHFWSGDRLDCRARRSIALLGDRRGLLRTARELDAFDADDVRWLRRPPPRAAGPLQRRPEGERRRSRPRSPCSSSSRGSCSGSASATRASASPAPSSSTTA